MYSNFAGIEVGKKDIKVSVVKRGLRDQRLIENFKINYNQDPEDSRKQLNKHLSKYSVPDGEMCTNIAKNPLSIRVLEFPFNDYRKIDQVYKFELENQSPFNPNDKHHSYHAIIGEDSAEAIVCMFERDDVRDQLEKLKTLEIDPKVLTFSPVSYDALNKFLDHKRPVLLVDVSVDELVFALFDEKGLKRIRSSSMSIKIEEFDTVDKETLSKNQSFQYLIDEIIKTTKFFESDLKRPLESLTFTGDICGIDGVDNLIEDKIGRKVKKLYIEDIGINESHTYAKSYALALYGSKSKNEQLNLRKDDFAYEGRNGEIKKVLILPFLLFFIFIVLAIYKSSTEIITYKRNIKDMNAQIQEEIKDIFPNVSVVPEPVKFLDNELTKVKDKLQLFEGVKGSSTPLDVIRDLSTTIPTNLDLSVDEIRFESGKVVKVWGRCNSYNEIASIEKSLSDSGMFKTVKREQVSRAVNNTIKFVVSLVLK